MSYLPDEGKIFISKDETIKYYLRGK